jgi:hypothetical protein
MGQQANTVELSFEWAKSGSWEQYEQELDKVIRKTAAVGVPGVLPLPSTGAAGAAGSAPVAPKPPAQPGILDQAKTFGSGLMDQASAQWGKLPTWGQGALIGGGIGALGGLLTDKRKGRGLLQGALLGGGLGALGGYAHSQLSPGNRPPADLSALGKAPTATPAAAPGTAPQAGWFDKNIATPVSSLTNSAVDATKSLWDKIPTSAAIAGGGYATGGVMSRMGNREARTFLGPETPSTGGLPVDYMRPTADMSLKHLQRSPEAMEPVLDQLARSKSPAYAPNMTTPEEAAAAMRAISRPQRLAGTNSLAGSVTAPHDFTSGGNAFQATNKDLINEHMAQLESGANGANVKLHSPMRALRNKLLYGGGKAVQVGSLAAGLANAAGMGASGSPVSQLSANMPLNDQTIPVLQKAFKQSSPEEVKQFIERADWLPEDKARLQQLGWGQ